MYPRRLLQEAAFAANMLSPPTSTQPLVADPAPSSPADATPSSNIFYVNSRFSPTMIIIVVVLLSSFLFMALFAVYVRRCSGEEGSVSQHGDSRPRSRRDAERSGVDPLVVESYPIVSYAIAKKKGCCECTVCLGEFEKGDELKQLPKCKHLFHPECIGLWLESHTTCPLCRRSLLNSDRWSVSFRWGDGSSRGGLRRSGQESSRSCRSGEITSSRFGQADSTSTGWIGTRSTVDDASCRGYPPQSAEMSLQFMEAGAVHEHSDSRALPNNLGSSPHGLRANYDQLAYTHRVPASLLASEVALCGPSGTAQASSVPSALMPHEIEECCIATNVMPHEYQSSEVAARGEHANAILSEVAASRSSELARGGGKRPRQAAAFPMSRSNSTGHLAGRRTVLQATRCMHRSRSVGVDVVEKKEERMVGPPRQVFHGSTRP